MIHRIVMWFVFMVGIICFSYYSFSQEFFLGTIILTISMLFINLYGFATCSLPSNFVFQLFSISIIFVAIAVMGNYGVEQKPIGYKTLYQFNLEGVAISLILFLISSLLLIIGKNQNKKAHPGPSQITKKLVNFSKPSIPFLAKVIS